MEIISKFGIIASISWNSNKWQNDPIQKDLKKSKYDFVKENAHMQESLNFGHEIYPLEEDGCFIAYTPMFNRLPKIENIEGINIVFFLSSDYLHDNRKCIIGFYGFPEIAKWFPREAKHDKYKVYDGGNVKSLVENIIFLDNHIIINNENAVELELLPKDKKISQMGFNYLNSENVLNILKMAYQLNEKNIKLQRFLNNFPIEIQTLSEIIEVNEQHKILIDQSADNLEGIRRLEERMKILRPQIKERVSTFIERGVISKKIKKLTGYRCLICEQLGQYPYSFKTTDSEYYIESHHVIPVSTQKIGILSVSNLITVCANHHRQMHYGDVEVLQNETDYFKFRFEDKELKIYKIII